MYCSACGLERTVANHAADGGGCVCGGKQFQSWHPHSLRPWGFAAPGTPESR